MANLLTLRAQPTASLLKLDAAFFRSVLRPLLEQRGLPKDAAITLAVDDAALERVLSGKQAVPPRGTLSATAATWRALLLASSAREQGAQRAARDVGGEAIVGVAPSSGAGRDWIRQKSGRRVKARPKTRMATIAAPQAPSQAASQAASTSAASDPAAFSAQNLARLCALVVDAVAAAHDSAVVEVRDGVVVVDGAAVRALRG